MHQYSALTKMVTGIKGKKVWFHAGFLKVLIAQVRLLARLMLRRS